MVSISEISPYTRLIAFLVGLPTLVGTYYQTWKARQEIRLERQALVYSENCLEFLLEDGTTINVVPLGILHTLTKTGDVVLLPGTGDSAARHSQPAIRSTPLTALHGLNTSTSASKAVKPAADTPGQRRQKPTSKN